MANTSPNEKSSPSSAIHERGKAKAINRRNKMILLGATVRDKSTGFEGVAVSRIEYMSGCIQYGVRPRYNETEMKGVYPPVEYIDEAQLEDVSKEYADQDSNPEKPPGGLQSARPRK